MVPKQFWEKRFWVKKALIIGGEKRFLLKKNVVQNSLSKHISNPKIVDPLKGLDLTTFLTK